MSWGGFKKSINRAGTSLMQKTGQVERTIDSEFSDEHARYKQFEKETLSLQKEAKAYLDSIRCESVPAFNRVAWTADIDGPWCSAGLVAGAYCRDCRWLLQ